MASIQRQIHTAIITGPTGAIGMALCAKLLAEGVTVYAVTHPGSARAALLPQDARLHVVPCDAAELAALPELIPEKADAFFHFAWAHTIGPGRNDMPAQIANIRYTIAACRAAAQLGCQVFIGAGSQAEYGRVEGVLTAQTPCFPENGYGMAKLCAGQMSRVECQTLGVAHIWTRILSVYGPHDGPATMISGTIRKLLHGEKPALTAGIQQWDYLYAADAAAAFYALAVSGQDGRVYPLGSGTARPLKDYIETLRDAIDPALPLGLGEVPYGPLQVMHLQADASALQEDTGWRPATPFEEGIRETIEWVRKETK